MDREDKLNALDSAYDLLKSLDDEDEEEESVEEAPSGVSSSSLARMLSVPQESLVGLPTVRDLPAIASVKIKSKAEIAAEVAARAEAAKAAEMASASEPVSDSSEEPMESSEPEEVAVKPKYEVPSKFKLDAPLKLDAPAYSKFDLNAKQKTEPEAKVEPEPAAKVEEKSDVAAEADASAKADVDTAKAETENAKAEAADAPRPSMPPPPPMASMVSKTRVLRDGETAYTIEQLREVMAGGKNDEAPDLAALKVGDNGWYAQVFNEDYLRTVPKSEPRQTRREARFIMERLGLESGARVLDLACGTGRHAIELAKEGYDMVGLDYSMCMLKRALADAQSAKTIIKFIHGDMQKLTFKAIFDAIYCVQTSFGYFDDLRNFRVLQGIYRALKPGGVFLIEVTNRDFIVEDLPMRLWWKGKDCKLLEEIDLEHQTGILKVKRSFVFDDSSRAPWEQNISIRLYTSSELRALLMRAGFNVLELSGDYSLPGAFFGATSPKIIYVAEKPIR